MDNSSSYWKYVKVTLPFKHKKTLKSEPEGKLTEKSQIISTGMLDDNDLKTWKDNIIGVIAWLFWGGLVTYSIFFTEIKPEVYILLAAGWVLTFMYVILLVPLRYRKLKPSFKESNV
jgi:hypothetical protein